MKKSNSQNSTFSITKYAPLEQRQSGSWADIPLLKELIIRFADWFAAFSQRRARKWLGRSRWWTAFAEHVETGEPMSEITNQRDEDHE